MFGGAGRGQAKVSWVGLYALGALMLTILGAVDTYMPEGGWRRTLELIVTVLGFGAMHLWLRSNRRAFDLAGQRDPGFRSVIEPSGGLEHMRHQWVGGEATSRRGGHSEVLDARIGRRGTVVALPRRRRVVGGSDIGAEHRER